MLHTHKHTQGARCKSIDLIPVWIVGCFIDQERSQVLFEEFNHVRLEAGLSFAGAGCVLKKNIFINK